MKRISLAGSCFTGLVTLLFFACNDSSKDKEYENVVKQRDLDRGKYLATIGGCLDCHSTRQFEYFSGPIKPGTEGMGGQLFSAENVGVPGMIFARNITQDSATGIGTWTEDEIYNTITTGINKKGDTLFPLMPYHHLNQMAKKDLQLIIGYIRTLKPVSNVVPPRQLFIPIAMAYAPPKNKNQDSIVAPAITDQVKYGEYLVTLADCFACHTAQDKKGQWGPPYSGGRRFKTDKFTVFSANITPDSTGLAEWNEAKFLNKFASYRDEANVMLDPGLKNSYMPWSEFAKLTDTDLKAIYAYLRTLPPVKNKVEKYPPGVE